MTILPDFSLCISTHRHVNEQKWLNSLNFLKLNFLFWDNCSCTSNCKKKFREIYPFIPGFPLLEGVSGWRCVFPFPCGYPVAPAPLVVKAIFFPLNCLCTYVKNQLGIFVWFSFWFLYFVSLIYVYFSANTTQSWIIAL